MTPKQSLTLDDKLENLDQFRQLWLEFGNFAMRIIKSGNPTPDDNVEYLQYIGNIAIRFPRVQDDIRRHELMVSKPVPSGGGTYSDVSDYMPFLNIATFCPSLSEICERGHFGAKEFRDEISIGMRMLLHTIGTLEFAKELGGEENLPSG